MKTRLANNKAKREWGIPKEKWDYVSFQRFLALDLFLAISSEMKKDTPTRRQNNDIFH